MSVRQRRKLQPQRMIVTRASESRQSRHEPLIAASELIEFLRRYNVRLNLRHVLFSLSCWRFVIWQQFGDRVFDRGTAAEIARLALELS